MSNKLQDAKHAIRKVFSDTSVSAEEALESLKDLRAEIEMLIKAIETDLENRE